VTPDALFQAIEDRQLRDGAMHYLTGGHIRALSQAEAEHEASIGQAKGRGYDHDGIPVKRMEVAQPPRKNPQAWAAYMREYRRRSA
jgi:hypothetical protein